MEQDNATSGGGDFSPTPFGEILRDEAPATPTETAGRQEPTAEAAPVETGESPVDLTKDTRPRDEQGRFAPKGEDQPATGSPPAEQKPPQMAPVAAVLEERKKRQEVEARLRDLEARLAAPQRPAQPPAAPAAPEVPLEDLMFQDPQRFIAALREPMNAELARTRLALSETVARQQPDWQEAEAAIVQLAQSNPEAHAFIRNMLETHEAPAMWALAEGRKLLSEQRWGSVIQQYGSPEAYLAAQQQSAPAALPVPSPSAPPTPPGSLASVRSAGPRTAAWGGPTPFSEILRDR